PSLLSRSHSGANTELLTPLYCPSTDLLPDSGGVARGSTLRSLPTRSVIPRNRSLTCAGIPLQGSHESSAVPSRTEHGRLGRPHAAPGRAGRAACVAILLLAPGRERGSSAGRSDPRSSGKATWKHTLRG